MEGDVEFNDDEDDLNGLGAGVITRRLNLTTNATGSFQSSQLTNSQLLQQQQRQSHKKFKKLIGHEAKLLFLKSFQFILKRQIRWLITEMRFPKEFEHVAKIIWLKILKTINDQPQEELKLRQFRSSTLHPLICPYQFIPVTTSNGYAPPKCRISRQVKYYRNRGGSSCQIIMFPY